MLLLPHPCCAVALIILFLFHLLHLRLHPLHLTGVLGLLLMVLLFSPLHPLGYSGRRGIASTGHVHPHAPHLAVLRVTYPRIVVRSLSPPGHEVLNFGIAVVLQIEVAVYVFQDLGEAGAIGAAFGGLDRGGRGVIQGAGFVIVAVDARRCVVPTVSGKVSRLWPRLLRLTCTSCSRRVISPNLLVRAAGRLAILMLTGCRRRGSVPTIVTAGCCGSSIVISPVARQIIFAPAMLRVRSDRRGVVPECICLWVATHALVILVPGQ